MRKNRFSNVPTGDDNPVNHAVQSRDSSTLSMVADAIQHKQTLLAYQSVVSANNPDRVGFYEGLIRVLDETGRVIPAREFMPVVERTELGREIDRLALKMGLQTLKENPGLRVAINMSARSIGYRPWMQTLNYWLRKDATLAERLILEITESSAMDQPETTMDFMDNLACRGVSFALDDFGAGFTSFRYLKDFLFDIIKIDSSFCSGISQDVDSQAIVKSLISVARHFEMLVVAEGVERSEDAQTLANMGVDCLQGYLFDAPTTRPHWAFGDRRQAQKSSTAA